VMVAREEHLMNFLFMSFNFSGSALSNTRLT
jgi:hypothetical protein